jgi:hypothetical protein
MDYFVVVTKREKRACAHCEESGVAAAPTPARIMEIDVAMDGANALDCALEFLICLGQVLWDQTKMGGLGDWLRVLNAGIESGVSGDLHEESLRIKRLPLSGIALASSPRNW